MSAPELGHFDPNMTITPGLLGWARGAQAAMPGVPKGDIDRIYLHWTADPWATPFMQFTGVYNVVVDFDGRDWGYTVPTSPTLNAASSFDLDRYAAHTEERNTGAVGIAIGGMVGATEQDFGKNPLTVAGLSVLCAVAAGVARAYGIDASGLSGPGPYGEYGGEHTILTHAEAANLPGTDDMYEPYGPPPLGTGDRWDIATFAPGVSVTVTTAANCGTALRTLIHRIKGAL